MFCSCNVLSRFLCFIQSVQHFVIINGNVTNLADLTNVAWRQSGLVHIVYVSCFGVADSFYKCQCCVVLMRICHVISSIHQCAQCKHKCLCSSIEGSLIWLSWYFVQCNPSKYFLAWLTTSSILFRWSIIDHWGDTRSWNFYLLTRKAKKTCCKLQWDKCHWKIAPRLYLKILLLSFLSTKYFFQLQPNYRVICEWYQGATFLLMLYTIQTACHARN